MPFLQTRGGGSASGFGVGSGSAEAFITAGGGQLTASWYDGTYEWKTHFFLSPGNSTFTLTDIPSASSGLNFVLVGGGGGGAGGHDSDWFGGGGGGAGGAVYKTEYKPNAGNYTITVGGSGSGGPGASTTGTGLRGGNGGATSGFSFTANGGGGGNPSGTSGASFGDGGCGGGTGSSTGYNEPGVTNQSSYGNATTYGTNGGSGYSTGSYPFGSGGGGLGSNGYNVNTAAGGHESEEAGRGGDARSFTDIFGTGTICNLGGGGGGGGAGGLDTDYNGGSAGDGADGGGNAGGLNYDGGIGAGGGGRGGRPRVNQRNGHPGAQYTGGGGGGGCGGPAGVTGTWGDGGYGGIGVAMISYKAGTAPAQAGSGRTAATAATSAKAILTNFPGSPDGLYWIAPTGGVGAQLVYCDMTTDGGGWMHVATFHDNNNIDFQAQPEVSPWGFYIHRTNLYAYDVSNNNGGRFVDNVFDEFVGVHYPLAFCANFKHPGLYSYAPVRQVLMKDDGAKLRNLWYTQQLGSAVANTRVWFGDGSNMWIDNGTSRNSTSAGFRNLSVTNFGQNDDVFGNSPTRVIFGFGEPSGVDTSNQDRSMITRYGTSDGVSTTQGIGVSRANEQGTSTGSPGNGIYQVYRDVDPTFRDETGPISATYNYTLWIRE